MSNTIQVRRGANASLPTLNAGEFGFSTDTYQVYIGDGTTNHELTTGAGKASIWLPAEAAYLPATVPAELVEVAGATVYPGYSVLKFDDTLLEKAMWRVPVPDINTTMGVSIYWIAAAAGAGNVIWKVGAEGINDNEVITVASVPTLTDTITAAAPSNLTKLNIDVDTSVATNATDNEMMLFLVERTGNDAGDTLDGDANLLGVLIEYVKV